MGTKNLRLWKQIEPELYIHAKFKGTVGNNFQVADLKSYSSEVARATFKEFFGDELDFEITIEDGSIKLRVKTTINTVVKILIVYGGLRAGGDYLCNDVSKAFEQVKNPIVESEYISDPIRVERRLGVVGRVDRTLLDYQKGRISHEECRDKLTRYFEIIYESPHGKEIADAMIDYNDKKHQDSTPWNDLKSETARVNENETPW